MKFSTIVAFLAQVAADTQYMLEVTFEKEKSCPLTNDIPNPYVYELRVTSDQENDAPVSSQVEEPRTMTRLKTQHSKQTTSIYHFSTDELQKMNLEENLPNRLKVFSHFFLGDLEVGLMAQSDTPSTLILFYKHTSSNKSIKLHLERGTVAAIPFSSTEKLLGVVTIGHGLPTDNPDNNRRLLGLAVEGGGGNLSESACSKVSHYEWAAWLTAVILLIVSAAVLATIYWVWRRYFQREALAAQESVEEEPNV